MAVLVVMLTLSLSFLAAVLAVDYWLSPIGVDHGTAEASVLPGGVAKSVRGGLLMDVGGFTAGLVDAVKAAQIDSVFVRMCAGSEGYSASPFQFDLQMTDGQLTQPELVNAVHPAFPSLILDPGQCVAGWLSYALAVGERPVAVQFRNIGERIEVTWPVTYVRLPIECQPFHTAAQHPSAGPPVDCSAFLNPS